MSEPKADFTVSNVTVVLKSDKTDNNQQNNNEETQYLLNDENNKPYGTINNNNHNSNDRILLNNLSFKFNSGSLIGIIGGSGSGKTTLLSILSGRLVLLSSLKANNNLKVTGKLRLNNQLFDCSNTNDLGKLANYSVFLPQFDTLPFMDTPYEAIKFNAMLRLSDDEFSYEQKLRQVNKMIEDLDLESCKDVMIGNEQFHGISGGEKKRTSIGCELIVSPNFIILDEPTTGLDTVNAYQFIRKLKSLVNENTLFIVALHQPSSQVVNLLDKLIILSEGNIVFNGNPKTELKSYINSYLKLSPPLFCNITEYFVNKIYYEPEKYKQKWDLYNNKKEPVKKKEITHFSQIEITSNFYKQSYEILKREMRVAMRRREPYKLRIGVSAVILICLCMLFPTLDGNKCKTIFDRRSVLFLLTTSCLLVSMGVNVFVIPQSKLILEKEYLSNKMYSLFSYLLSQFIVAIPIILIQCLLYVIIVRIFIDLNMSSIQLYFDLLLIILAGDSLGFFIGSFSPTVKLGLQFTNMIHMIGLLFGGFLVLVSTITPALRWLRYLSLPYYGYSVLLTHEFTGHTFSQCTDYFGTSDVGGKYILSKALGINPSNLVKFTVVLFCSFIILRFLATMTLFTKFGKNQF